MVPCHTECCAHREQSKQSKLKNGATGAEGKCGRMREMSRVYVCLVLPRAWGFVKLRMLFPLHAPSSTAPQHQAPRVAFQLSNHRGSGVIQHRCLGPLPPLSPASSPLNNCHNQCTLHHIHCPRSLH